MLERLTEQARTVLTVAIEEAIRRGDQALGTEHLLVALGAEGRGLSAQVLDAAGLGPRVVRDHLGPEGGSGDAEREVPWSQHAVKALELSNRLRSRLGHNYVATEHLLAGVLGVPDGRARIIGAHAGVDVDRVLDELLASMR